MASGGAIKVHVVNGDLAEHAADVLVNSVGNDLNLKAGPVCRALLRKGGPELEEECKRKYPNGIKKGVMARSKGYRLPCQKVYHVTLPFFNSGKNYDDHTPEQMLFKTVLMCLNQANSEGRHTIAFPALGVGTLGFPPDMAAEALCDAVCDFEQNNSKTSLQEVHIVIFGQDPNSHNIKCAFDNEASRPRPGQVDKFQSFYKKVKAPVKPVMLMTPNVPRPVSSQPKRGSKEYFKYLFKKDLRTPRYWTKFTSSHKLDDFMIESKLETTAEIDVDAATFQEVSQLVLDTWQRERVGHGVDAQGLSHKALKIRQIHRIENVLGFYAYATCRQAALRKSITKGSALAPLEQVFRGQEPILTSERIKQSPPTGILRQDLYYELNECYLFHGTPAVNVGAIVRSGLDSRLSSADCMHGRGVYFAESSTKSDQYADCRQSRTPHGRKMILSRVCLGEQYVGMPWNKFVRPPCKECFKDNCKNHKTFFDSVVTKSGEKLFREFVVYQPQQAYPEYVITYDRV